MSWQPSASLEHMRARAEMLQRIRTFFLSRGVLEVETPLLCQAGITDPSIEPLMVTRGQSIDSPRYLQTSPEYAMKRLLAAGSGPIFQICRAFRDGEAGARHNPEFSLLEWYRPGWDHHRLMDELTELVCHCLGRRELHKLSYRELFMRYLQVDPHRASVEELAAIARQQLDTGTLAGDRDLWLDLLLSHVLEPRLAELGMCFIYDYPASQAALSRIVEQQGGVKLGQRFELYVDGLELANGYFELCDAGEQRRRFEADNHRRRQAGQEQRPVDERLLSALEHGLPPCSGVALGIDRLLMLAVGTDDIRQVVSFDWQRS